MTEPTRTALVAAILLGAAGLAGCKTTPSSTATVEKPKAAKTDYQQVNSMGSWIPRKVKKQSDLIGDSTKVVDGSALERVQQAGHTKVPRDTGR
jgi:curli biogenesis system outer membrane secretion channel CsgG